jgi:hypothetical protein
MKSSKHIERTVPVLIIGELNHNDRINYKIGSYDPLYYINYSALHSTIVYYIPL